LLNPVKVLWFKKEILSEGGGTFYAMGNHGGPGGALGIVPRPNQKGMGRRFLCTALLVLVATPGLAGEARLGACGSGGWGMGAKGGENRAGGEQALQMGRVMGGGGLGVETEHGGGAGRGHEIMGTNYGSEFIETKRAGGSGPSDQ